MNNIKTVLVTGSSGFIGREVVIGLERAGWIVTKAVRNNGRSLVPGEIYIDLDHPETLLDLSDKVKFDAIVHLAAKIGWSGCSESEMYASNVLSTGLLAHLAKTWNAFLVFSSAAIVCGIHNEEINSNSPIKLDTIYGKSKFLAEELIRSSDIQSCILRIGGTFGYLGPTHLGLNRSIDFAVNGRLPVQVGLGKSLRNYIYNKDVARAIAYVLENRIEGTHFLSGTEVISIAKMLQEICNVFLPGKSPILTDGPKTNDQIIQPSLSLPGSLRFHEALIDIRCSL